MTLTIPRMEQNLFRNIITHFSECVITENQYENLLLFLNDKNLNKNVCDLYAEYTSEIDDTIPLKYFKFMVTNFKR